MSPLFRRSSATPPVAQERRKRWVAGLGLAALGFVPVVPGRAGAGPAPAAAPAVFAAGAEAWAYSVEVGVPGPLGPLASHTTVSIDNSPHAQGAAGLADPGYLVRAAAQLVAGVPTPAYCESAWPEGPDHADCGAPGGAAAVSRTHSGAGPDATATAGLGEVAVGSGASALAVAAQSTTSVAALGPDGLLHARADVNLSGISVAGGALRIGTLTVHRDAVAGGLPAGAQTSTAVSVGDISVAGKPVAPGNDPVRRLAQAAQQAFGDKLVVDGLSGTQQQTPDGKLVADSAGLQIIWRPQKDRSVRIVLGYGRVLVYATAPPVAPAPVESVPSPGAGAVPGTGTAGPAANGEPPTPNGKPSAPPSALAAASPGPDAGAGGTTVASPGADGGAGNLAAGPSGGTTEAAPASPPSATVPLGRPLAAAARRPVRWVSPFLVLAQMTTGRQAWWFLLALIPLVAAAVLSRRSGLGLVAPWSRP
jgi:hypothetical protein